MARFLAAALFFTLACSPRVTTPVVVPGPAFLHHTIKFRGENLALIAKWYSGEASKWPLIREQNPHVDPMNLQLGQRLRIPLSLALRRDDMPETFFRSHRKRAVVSRAAVLPSNPSGGQPADAALPADASSEALPSEGESALIEGETFLSPTPAERMSVPPAEAAPQGSPAVRDRLIENLLPEK
ncbi:MAG: LysM peptidoglycan-binding domain-containing protein [Bdellovibrionales bacterium]|nr:LysM peptidoglycan-binding domain-containing protein [Bdellovibrionales bacterium]